MRRRLALAFSILCTAAALAACGDAGDHLGEFRQNPPSPVVVEKLSMVMPIVALPQTKKATFKLYVTAYADGKAIPVGTNLQSPIVITTNYTSNVIFGKGGATTIHFSAAPPPITITYTQPRNNPCSPVVAVTAFNHDALPQFQSVNVVSCGSSTPTPSPTTSPTGRPSPTPTPTTKPSPTPTSTPTPTPLPAVKRLVLTMPSTPNPLSPGTFTLVVTAYNSGGKTITPGTVLVNPIQLTSNSSCSIGFIAPGGSGSATSLQLTSAPGSVNITYSPPSAGCTPPSQITITAYDHDAASIATFSILGGTATVTGIQLSMLSLPNTSSEGVYPLFVNATGSGGSIPFGITLTNPIELSSNASCALGFGITLNPGTFTPTYQMTSTQTQVYVSFDPSNPTCTPPTGGNAIIQAIASGSPPVNTTFTFPY